MSDDFDPDLQPAAPARSGPPWTLIALVIVAVVSAVFVFQNGGRTEVQFLFFDANSRVWVAIALAIGLGMILDRLLITWWRRSRRNKN